MSDGAPVMLALAIASAATAVVALGMLFMHLRRTSRLTALTGGLGAASVAALLPLLLVVIGQPAQAAPQPASAQLEVTPYALENYQLDTLAVP